MIEVIVVLAVLGIVAGVGVVGLGRVRPVEGSEVERAMQKARAEAVRSGRAVEETDTVGGAAHQVRFLPDGRAIGDDQ